MALLTETGNYVKLETDGKFIVYDTEDERLKEKNSTSSEEISTYFKHKIEDLEEKVYFSRGNEKARVQKEYTEWMNEYLDYCNDLKNKTHDGKYKLIKEVYPTILNSLPNVFIGSMPMETSVDDFYQLAKKNEYWGNTKDV